MKSAGFPEQGRETNRLVAARPRALPDNCIPIISLAQEFQSRNLRIAKFDETNDQFI
jgi:hypothetical protein